MKLCVDCGNSTAAFAFLKSPDRVEAAFRVGNSAFTEGGVCSSKLLLEEFGRLSAGISAVSEVDSAAIGSVASPQVTDCVIDFIMKRFGVRPNAVAQGQSSLFEKKVYPELGDDIYANLIAARYRHPDRNILVFDFGTANVAAMCDKSGHLRGVSIAPGFWTGMKILSSSTALIGDHVPESADIAPGMTTAAALSSGAVMASVGMLEKAVGVARETFPDGVFTVVTGGCASVASKYTDVMDETDEFNTVKGIYVCSMESGAYDS